MGPIARKDSRQQVVQRIVRLLTEAKSRGCDLAVFPELALTTFFPDGGCRIPPRLTPTSNDLCLRQIPRGSSR